MSRSALKFSAVALSLSIVLVLFAGLDNLPRAVRAQIDSERASLASARAEVQSAQDAVNRGVQSDPALYNTLPAAHQWPAAFGQSTALLASAARDMDSLAAIEKQNRRTDAPRAQSLLSEERGYRNSAVTQADSVQKDAAHWEDLKQNLPATLRDMQRDHDAIHAYDLAALTTTVQKAETDWPDKKTDLDARLTAERNLVTDGDHLWDSSAAPRAQAASGNLANLDYGTLLTDAGQLHTDAAALPANAAELQSLTGQLYTSWDKVLADMETRGIGTSKEYDQQIETIKTQQGATTSDTRWEEVPHATYQAMQGDLGMAIAHKPLGKYDSEADHVAQPAGFAYMAPPAQGSNQYGYWDHSGGQSFWVFYGQYALMRDLLFRHDYRPLDRGEWDNYRDYQTRGQTYYGNDGASGQKYGTQGATTQQRYSGSSYAQSGGFKSSQYASKPGGFGASKYASPSSGPGKVFGQHGGAPPVARSFHPAPAPRSFHMPSGGGHHFGRH